MIMYLKRLKSSKFVRVKAFPMYGGIGVSAPSLHRESTDSLIIASTSSADPRRLTVTINEIKIRIAAGRTSIYNERTLCAFFIIS